MFSALGSVIRLKLQVWRDSDSDDVSHVEVLVSVLRNSGPVTFIRIQHVDLLAYQSAPNRVEKEGFEARLILGSCGLLRLSLEDYGASTLALHLKPSRPLWLEGIQIHQPKGSPFGPKSVFPHPAMARTVSYPLRISEPTRVLLSYLLEPVTRGVLPAGHPVDLDVGFYCRAHDESGNYFRVRVEGTVPAVAEETP
jgi:hypothetical protein